MTTVTPLHAYFRQAHLARVIGEMRVLGPPAIRAYPDAETGVWFAFEGTHRLRAALWLGIPPVLIPVRWPRSKQALENARFAAALRGLEFPRVAVDVMASARPVGGT